MELANPIEERFALQAFQVLLGILLLDNPEKIGPVACDDDIALLNQIKTFSSFAQAFSADYSRNYRTIY